ncbi:hypothetical protein [Solitalea canadensis]|uniref:hypothetical protein n=1 Tax=Solitalea canadensis TaxID=995 RepID=UPI0002D3EBD8|nr:hypothetical protein [Solitalea canadensis]
MKRNKDVSNKRYYFNRRLKEKYEINGAKRTIELPFTAFEQIPQPDRYYVGQLIKQGYNVQFKLF